MKALVIALVSSAYAGAHNDWSGHVVLPENTTAIDLFSVEGDIDVRVDADARQPLVIATDFRPGRSCKLEVVKDRRGRTQVHYGPKDQESARACRAEFELVLPAGMDLKVELGVGDVLATGMSASSLLHVDSGDVELVKHSGFAAVNVGNGDVTLRGVTGQVVVDLERGRLSGASEGPIRARVGDGMIDLQGLKAGIEADTGVGDIRLAWDAVPTSGVMLNAGDGHVIVDLPNGTAVQPRMSSMTGTTSCELPEGNDVELVAVAGMGSVRVH